MASINLTKGKQESLKNFEGTFGSKKSFSAVEGGEMNK